MSIRTMNMKDTQFSELSVLLAQMGGMVESLLTQTLNALERKDSALANGVIAADIDVDIFENEIDAKAITFLEVKKFSSEQLRHTITTMKIANTLERIGDLAKNVAKRSKVISLTDTTFATASVLRMGRSAARQVSDVLNAMSEENPDAAVAVWGGDQNIDELYNSIYQEILSVMTRDSSLAGHCTHLIFVAKNFERIGDHATNMAERVYFRLTGDILTAQRPKSDVTSLTDIGSRNHSAFYGTNMR